MNQEAELVPFEKRYWYPHMQQDHVSIWERFIATYPESYDTCQYDVTVGSVPGFTDPAHPVSVPGQEKLYKKKIDVVAFKGGNIDIIEIKPKANASAVGQVKRYVYLYSKEFAPGKNLQPVIVTDSMDDDDREFARDEGVLVVVV